MKYIVTVNGERTEVELGDGQLRSSDGDTPARLREVAGTPVRLVTLGDSVHRVVAQPTGGRGRYTLWVDGWRYEVEALDERRRAIADMTGAAAAASGPAPLTAPMPGLIVRVMVTEGEVVQAGQGLVVMEAMKMENELRAPAGGTVVRVLATPGTAVERGSVLVELE